MGMGGVDSLLFLSQTSSEVTVCNMPILWAWAIKYQWLSVTAVIPVHKSGKQGEIKTASLQTKFICLFVPWSLIQTEMAQWSR